jgi:thiol-disulfide isomerase/thioredoxin
MQQRLSSRIIRSSIAFAALFAFSGRTKDLPKAELVLKDLKGQRVRLSQLRGKIVVLNFWATWCGPCNAEMPMLVELEKKYSAQGIVFIGASLDEPKARSRIPPFLASHGIDFPVWVGATADDLDRLEMGPAVPATAFLDAEGRIVSRVQGQLRKEEVVERLDWLRGFRPDTPPAALVKHLGNQ